MYITQHIQVIACEIAPQCKLPQFNFLLVHLPFEPRSAIVEILAGSTEFIKTNELTSSAGTGGSKLFNFLTATFISEKNAWDAPTSSMPVLFSIVSLVREQTSRHFRLVEACQDVNSGCESWGAGVKSAAPRTDRGMSINVATSGVFE